VFFAGLLMRNSRERAGIVIEIPVVVANRLYVGRMFSAVRTIQSVKKVYDLNKNLKAGTTRYLFKAGIL